MFDALSLPPLLGIFLAAAVAIWVAGVRLSDSTDILSARLGLGEALGGVILLAIATNLPEIAITASAAWTGHVGVAVGNILGGIAIQTVVLAMLDLWGKDKDGPLTYRAASLTLAIEGVLVIAVLIVAIMATQLPETLIVARIAPGSLLIVIFWIVGVWLIGRAHQGLPWQIRASGDDAPQVEAKAAVQTKAAASTVRAALSFGVAAAVTLIAGVLLERSGVALADQVEMSGVLFGATVLAAATSLPELSTGLAAIRLGSDRLAISDILGGNAFLPVLFMLATLVSGQAVLPQAQDTDIYLAGLGVLLTAVYIGGLVFRSKRRLLGMGVDSLVVIVLYLVGIAGLFAIALDGRHPAG